MNEILTIVKDVILILGSATSTIFAFRTYNKWKQEHKGKLKYDLCRNSLKSLYTIRDSYKSVRSPMLLSHETMPGYLPGRGKDSENLVYIFNNRLAPLREQLIEFEALLPEIEIEFGTTLRKECDNVNKEIFFYQMTLKEFIRLSGNEEKNWDKEGYQDLRLKVYNIGENNDATIAFEKLIASIAVKIEKEIKHY